MEINHYKYAEEHLLAFWEKLGVEYPGGRGILGAHGDKGSGYSWAWEKAGIPFHKGMMIYYLTYMRPFNQEVRETKNGWVDPGQWVIDNKDKFLPLLP